MTCKDFVIWLRGFVQASNSYNITPKQWDDVKHMLGSVNVEEGNLKITRYSLDASADLTYTNPPEYSTNATKTYGRSEDDVTYTSENKKVF